MKKPKRKSTISDVAASGLLHTGVGWANHHQFPDYLVGQHGEVISMLNYPPKILKTNTSGKYPTYMLKDHGGEFKSITKHVLVAETWIEPRPEGMECCHNDGNRLNGEADNLRWDTKLNNEKDKKIHGTHRFGARINFTKTTPEAVIAIRRLRKAGNLSNGEIARKFNMSPANVGLICSGASWAHIREGLDD